MTVATLEPGSAEWLQYITASKMAAILGVSPWESPRSLWHLMRGDMPAEEQTDEQARGHYLEPAVLAWFFDQHPDLKRRSTGQQTFFHPLLQWAAATPDAIADTSDADPWSFRCVEAKTSADDDEWGTPGTDEIPTYYAAQGIWTMHVTGTDLIYVPVLTTRLQFAEYFVQYDAEVAAMMEKRALAFLELLTESEPPPLDAHPSTYESLRRVNPDIDRNESVELDEADARRFVDAKRALNTAEAAYTYAKSTVAEAMGTARLAFHDRKLIARRQNASNGRPYVKAVKPLPDLTGDQT